MNCMSVIINRVWSMPSAWTFSIKPIKDLIFRYIEDGKGWCDPFCGRNNNFVEFTNDVEDNE